MEIRGWTRPLTVRLSYHERREGIPHAPAPHPPACAGAQPPELEAAEAAVE